MKIIQLLTFACLMLFSIYSFAQVKKIESFNLKWDEKGLTHTVSDGSTAVIPYFANASFTKDISPLPQFHTSYKLKSNSDIKARISNIDYYAHVEFVPIIYDGQKYQKVVSFDLNLEFTQKDTPLLRTPPFKNTSALANGDIYKLEISENGMHVLSYDFLKSEIGIDIDNIDPSNIQIYSGARGILPEANSIERVDDLEPVSMEMIGTEDGTFNNQDRIIFYAESASVDKFDLNTQTGSRPINIYDDNNFYYLKVGDVVQNLIQNAPSISNTVGSTNEYDFFTHIEDDEINILHEYPFTQGSGKIWYMQKFDGLREQTYEINIPNLAPNSSARFQSVFAGRSEGSSRFNMVINGESFASPTISGVRTTDIESSHATRVLFSKNVTLTSEKNTIKIEYPQQASFASSGWLDYINVNARCQLILESDELTFRDFSSLQNASTTFNLRSNVADTRIWNITNPTNAKNINLGGNITGNISFGLNTNTLQNMIAFDYANITRQPEFVEQIENQNLHDFQNADVVII